MDALLWQTEPVPLPPSSSSVALLVGSGHVARRVTLDGRQLLRVGAADDTDLVLVDRAVSARHCAIERTDDGHVVRDLGSRNGTWVDGVRVDAARLAPGMRLRLGRTDIVAITRVRPGDLR